MYIERRLAEKLKHLASGFPALFLTGPRQSGKSTLLRRVFSGHEYVNLEEEDTRRFALEDPRGFLDARGERTIIDEAQRAPGLFSYIQARIDESDEPGRYILSGSQNFLMLKSISQSLAGRVGILTLLPLSLEERMDGTGDLPDANAWLVTGGYPRLFSANIAPRDYYPSYIHTYVERDVRLETGVQDLSRFRRFLKICAARTGTPVNLADMGRDVSADARTVGTWLSILEESYLVFRLKPWYGNFGKRQTKTAKLYFHDTGLLCSLLGLNHPEDLAGHSMRGPVFENAVISELAKRHFNDGREPPFYFWRDSDDRDKEIDLLIENPRGLDLVEIKSSRTANPKYTNNIRSFLQNKATGETGRFVVYDGPDGLRAEGTTFVNWQNLRRIGGRA